MDRVICSTEFNYFWFFGSRIAQSIYELGYGLTIVVRFPAWAGNLSLHHRVQTDSGACLPPIQWVPGVKRQWPEIDHSLPSSAEVKNAWSYTSTPQYVFMAWCLLKHRNDFKLLVLHTYTVASLPMTPPRSNAPLISNTTASWRLLSPSTHKQMLASLCPV
jgi:hypothetical protein